MKLPNLSYRTGVERVVMLVLLIYPALMFGLKGGMNTAFAVLLLLALLTLIKRPKGLPAIVWQREYTYYSMAMVGMTLAILLSQIANQKFGGHAHDAATRYWLAVPIFLLLQRMSLAVFKVLQFTFPLAAIVGFLLAKNLLGNVHVELGGRVGISRIDLIHFGDYAMLLGLLSLLSINWFARDPSWLRLLKVVGFALGVLTSIGTGSRGGWLIIPVVAVLFIYFNRAEKQARVMLGMALTGAVVAALVLLTPNLVSQRMSETAQDVQIFEQGKQDTSTGIRLQLYQAATEVFMLHPLFGVGPQGFTDQMRELMEAGRLTPAAADLGRGEVHNDMLAKAAGMGIFGVVSLLAIYLVPTYLFLRSRKSSESVVRRAALMGAVLVAAHAVFGLTVEFLNLALATAFYSLSVAILLAFCYNRQYVCLPPDSNS